MGWLLLAVIVIAAWNWMARSKSVAASGDEAGQQSAPALIYTAAPRYDEHAWMRGGERFPRGATLMRKDDAGTRALVTGFAASADANVSFDGKTLLFAGRKAARDPWRIYEVAAEGGKAKLVSDPGSGHSDHVTSTVTTSNEDIIRPLYLPGNRVVYARRTGGRFVLETLDRETGKTLRLSYAPGNYLPQDVLRDGRVLFASGYPLGAGGAEEIYTVYSDGSGVEADRCDHGRARWGARQLASGDIAFTHGASELGRGLARFTSPLAAEEAVTAPRGEYAGDVAEVSAETWLVAHRASTRAEYAIVRWHVGDAAFETVAHEAGMQLVEPVMVTPRAVPNRHPTALHEWTSANLLALDAHQSRGAQVAGEIARVRAYTVDSSGHVRMLGESAVEADGSFFVQVPGDTPVRFELVSPAGKVVRTEAGWMWARAGEQRICVGCHAGPERAPDNRVPAVLVRTQTPADLTGHGGAAEGGH
jgi:hypothetical protein